MESPRLIVLALLAGLCLAGCRSEETSNQSAEWLTVLQGRVAAVDEELIAIYSSPTVVAFTDRPERRVGYMSLEDYVDHLWGEGSSFVQDPPNAALAVQSGSADSYSVLTITNIERRGGMLFLSYNVLEGVAPPEGAHIVATIDSADDINLHFINQSNDENNSSVVIFQKDAATSPSD